MPSPTHLQLPPRDAPSLAAFPSTALLVCLCACGGGTCPAPASPAVVTPAPAAAPPRGPSGTPSARALAACEVWDRENSFSQSVRDHDAKAFAEHLLPGAVFVNGPDDLLRGREAVATGWAKILAGGELRLEWHPTSVEAASDGVALSRGPYWIEIVKPGEPTKWLGGVFQSTWAKDTDGVWRVAFDGGLPPPGPTTEEQVKAIKASIPAHCPQRW